MPIPEIKISHITVRPGGRVRWEMDEAGRHRIVVNNSTSELSQVLSSNSRLADMPGVWCPYSECATWISEDGREMYVAMTEYYLDELPADRLNCALLIGE